MTNGNQPDRFSVQPDPPRLVTVNEAGRMLCVSRSTVYELIQAGELEVVHIRRAVRVPVDAVAAYIAGRGRDEAS